MFDIDSEIERWKLSFSTSDAVSEESVIELETHLRELTADLGRSGLSQQEAFLVATHRLGHPSDLECEFERSNGVAVWRRRVLWMLCGYVASAVGGGVISIAVTISALGASLAGLSGTVTGITMMTVLALGWTALLSLAYRQSQSQRAGGLQLPVVWGIAACVVPLAGFAVRFLGGILQARFVASSQFAESQQWFAAGGWAVQMCVFVASLYLIRA